MQILSSPPSIHEKIPVYFMPGMGANSKIFERIHLDENIFESYFLEWLEPLPKESLHDYCSRLLPKITHPNPILIGVSFGGIIMQELAKRIDVRKVVIISSVKSPKEFSKGMQWLKKTRLYLLMPTRWVLGIIPFLEKKVRSKKMKRTIQIYAHYLTMRSPNYLHWAIKQMMEWRNDLPLKNIVHIHGKKDQVFPAQYITDAYMLPNATHALILVNAYWLNQNLPNLLTKES